MLSNDDDGGGSGVGSSAILLMRIAEVLDCSTSAFSDSASCDLAQTLELLKLWSTIEHEQDRNKVLGFVRSAAQQQVRDQGPSA